MAQDWMKRNSWSPQTSLSTSQSETSGYKAHGEDIELRARHKQNKSNSNNTDQLDVLPSSPPTVQTRNGSILQPRKIVKSFQLTTKPFGLNITVTETTHYQQAPVYFAVCTEFKPKQPDIALFTGGDRNGNRLAVAYFRFSRHIRMGVGTEALSTGEGRWEEMKNTSSYLGHGKYEFEYDVPDNDDADFSWDLGTDVSRTRKKFIWERTRDEADGVKGVVEQYAGWRNYRLVEQDTGRVLAVMLTSMFTGCSYKGDINFHVSMSKEMETVAVLTATSICEKGERRIRRYAFGGGGNGP